MKATKAIKTDFLNYLLPEILGNFSKYSYIYIKTLQVTEWKRHEAGSIMWKNDHIY